MNFNSGQGRPLSHFFYKPLFLYCGLWGKMLLGLHGVFGFSTTSGHFGVASLVSSYFFLFFFIFQNLYLKFQCTNKHKVQLVYI